MPGTPAEILEEARKFIGVETELAPDRYPVEYDTIRSFCHISDDPNPLFLDPEYARQTIYGEVVCPPLLITTPVLEGNGPWPPAERVPSPDCLCRQPPVSRMIAALT